MPGTFPAAAPTLSGDSLTISRFLQNPALIQRRLRDYRDLRFVSDQLLTQRFRSQGGAVLYEQSEPFLTDRAVEAVGAGSVYPYANLATGTAAVAAISKWGQKVLLTDEEIARNAYAGSAIDRSMRKVVNSIIKQVDAIAMSAIQSAAADTATAGSWDNATAANRKPLEDILLAVQRIEDRNQGYRPDTLVVSPKAYTYLMLNDAIAQLRQRESTDNPVYTGEIETVAGLTVIKTPSLGTGALVLDSQQLGGMADETDGAPGYAVSDLAVQVKAIRKDDQDAWDLQGRRKTVPIVQESGAVEEISGVVS
ncbi:phage major capsid protein [Micromonospora fluostatini]